MSTSLFLKTSAIVGFWIKNNEEKFKSHRIKLEIVKNSAEGMFLILNFRKCLASIVVAKDDFAPYRFVAFEAVDMINDVPEIVHSWYDNDKTSADDIVYNLDRAVEAVIEYEKVSFETSSI